MVQFERNLNVYGIGEPLLFPIKRAGQPEIHLARLLLDFFEFGGGKCIFKETSGEIIMNGFHQKNRVVENWTISDTRGDSTPNRARNSCRKVIKDVDLTQSLRNMVAYYPKREIDMALIIGIGGEGTVLKLSSERLKLYLNNNL